MVRVYHNDRSKEEVGDMEFTTDRIRMRRLEWLGHLARMPNDRLPKSVLLGWLPEPWPRCGPRKQ